MENAGYIIGIIISLAAIAWKLLESKKDEDQKDAQNKTSDRLYRLAELEERNGNYQVAAKLKVAAFDASADDE